MTLKRQGRMRERGESGEGGKSQSEKLRFNINKVEIVHVGGY